MAGTDTLIGELQLTENKIRQRNATLVEAQEDLQRQNAKKSALQNAISEIEKGKQAVAAQQSTAENARKEAETLLAALTVQLDKRLAADVRIQVESAQAAVRAATEKLVEAKTAAVQNVAAAKRAQLAAERTVSEREFDYQQAQAQLQQLSARIAAVKDEAVRLKSAAKAAFDGNRDPEAWWLTLALKQALEELDKETGKGPELASLQADAGVALENARDEAATKKRESAAQENAQASAEAELRAKEQEREKDMKSALETIAHKVVPAAPSSAANRPSKAG